jgi:hypothetical protein
MRTSRRHTGGFAGCEAAACGVLSRERTLQVRPLPAALPAALLAPQKPSQRRREER